MATNKPADTTVTSSTPVPTETAAPGENLVILDADKLAQTIAATVAQVMATMQQNQQNQAAAPFDMTTLGLVIGEAVAQGIAKNTRRRVSIGEYEPRSPFHPGPKATKPVLRRQVWQNDALVQAHTLFDEEINLLKSPHLQAQVPCSN